MPVLPIIMHFSIPLFKLLKRFIDQNRWEQYVKISMYSHEWTFFFFFFGLSLLVYFILFLLWNVGMVFEDVMRYSTNSISSFDGTCCLFAKLISFAYFYLFLFWMPLQTVLIQKQKKNSNESSNKPWRLFTYIYLLCRYIQGVYNCPIGKNVYMWCYYMSEKKNVPKVARMLV